MGFFNIGKPKPRQKDGKKFEAGAPASGAVPVQGAIAPIGMPLAEPTPPSAPPVPTPEVSPKKTGGGGGDMMDADLAILTIAMPANTNPAGDIFGGWLMSQMDLAAGSIAARRSRGRCATVAVDGFHFLTPVQVGDEVSVYARIIRVGRTSMSLKVEAFRRARDGEEKFKVTEADFTFVALDGEGKPRQLS